MSDVQKTTDQDWCDEPLVDRLCKATPRSQRKAALLETALANMLYEVTHLSPMNDDGSHQCRISAEAVRLAREALNAE